MKRIGHFYILGIALLLFSCKPDRPEADAFGNFTVKEILISAETAGKIIQHNFDEGSKLLKGEIALIIDTVQFSLKQKELEAKNKAVLSKLSYLETQIDVLDQQKKNALRDMQRIENMLKDGAATQKQYDDIKGNIDVVELQIKSLQTNKSSVYAESSAIIQGINQLQNMVDRSKVVSPVEGIVLNSYAEIGEAVAPGKPLFKMANLEYMELKAYVSGAQLAHIELNQKVKVLIDLNADQQKEYDGELIWIASEAEFTPKNIQTREERISQVYAIKIKVKNDGALKINMPAEVVF